MDRELLRKVQLIQLEIAKEVKRVCDENDIPYFLCFGTVLGAVRHHGFIPWDDDLDIGMIRKHYERFLEIAPKALKPEFYLHTWHVDPQYALPFAKVRKRGTLYLEGKSTRLKENGFYIDIFPFDYLPAGAEARGKLDKKLITIFRTKLMKSGYTPWMENGKVLWHKRLGYLYYQALAALTTHEKLIAEYERLVASYPENEDVYWQDPAMHLCSLKCRWCEDLTEMDYEGEPFKVSKQYHEMLTAIYGDYMKLPPENQRENRHQIEAVDFGETLVRG